VKLLDAILETVLRVQLKSCGNRYLQSIVSVRFAIQRLAAEVLPSKRHQAVGKETGKTSYIERLNCTLRQRVSRLVRKTLSFSKKLENHIGAIWNFIHHYNASLPIA
jgi:IS1 family transposase